MIKKASLATLILVIGMGIYLGRKQQESHPPGESPTASAEQPIQATKPPQASAARPSPNVIAPSEPTPALPDKPELGFRGRTAHHPLFHTPSQVIVDKGYPGYPGCT